MIFWLGWILEIVSIFFISCRDIWPSTFSGSRSWSSRNILKKSSLSMRQSSPLDTLTTCLFSIRNDWEMHPKAHYIWNTCWHGEIKYSMIFSHPWDIMCSIISEISIGTNLKVNLFIDAFNEHIYWTPVMLKDNVFDMRESHKQADQVTALTEVPIWWERGETQEINKQVTYILVRSGKCNEENNIE